MDSHSRSSPALAGPRRRQPRGLYISKRPPTPAAPPRIAFFIMFMSNNCLHIHTCVTTPSSTLPPSPRRARVRLISACAATPLPRPPSHPAPPTRASRPAPPAAGCTHTYILGWWTHTPSAQPTHVPPDSDDDDLHRYSIAADSPRALRRRPRRVAPSPPLVMGMLSEWVRLRARRSACSPPQACSSLPQVCPSLFVAAARRLRRRRIPAGHVYRLPAAPAWFCCAPGLVDWCPDAASMPHPGVVLVCACARGRRSEYSLNVCARP
jgi:hypothetical protein